MKPNGNPRMKLVPLLCSLGAVSVILNSSLAAADFSLSSIAADKRLWPSEVHLTQPAPLKLMGANGQEIGSTLGQAGLLLKVLRIEPTRLLVQFGTSSAVVDASVTDLLKQSEAMAQRIQSTSAPSQPAPALSPTPEISSASAPLEPKGGSKVETGSKAGKIISFKTGWVMKQGDWRVASDTEIGQSDPKSACTNAYIPFPQSGKMEFRMQEKYRMLDRSCNTIYIFCSDGEQAERGTSYMIADFINKQGGAEVSVTRFTNNKRKVIQTFKPVDRVVNQWIDLVIVYDANIGRMNITRNGKLVGTCTDPDPIKEGKDFSIGTCRTPGEYKDIQIRSLN